MEKTPTPIPIPIRRPRRRRWTVAALVAGFVLLGAACGSSGNGSASAGASSGSNSVKITSPADGAQVGRDVEVKIDLGFPVGKPDTGRKHIHLHVDGSSQYEISYTDTHTLQLEPGHHEIVAVVANADHSETSSRSATVTVDVSGTAGASSGGSGGTTSTTRSGSAGY
jgi:hypothetical protein